MWFFTRLMADIKWSELWKGDWSSSTQYGVSDTVSYNGSSYTCISTPPVGTAPTNTTYWQLVAQKGADGTGDVSGPSSSTNNNIAVFDGTTGKAIKDGGKTISEISGSKFWADVPGTPTRVSDTQFTITDTGNANYYDKLFQKGVILRWSESGTFQTAMVVSSSYATDTVTINIVGDSLSSGFTDMKYCIQMAMMETFIIPGTLATGTDLAKTFYAPYNIYVLSADAYVKTAGSTNSTVFDINDDGTTKFTTKPTIASGSTSDTDNVADNPSTAVAKGSLITVDIDSVSTTPPVEAYIYLFYYPESWRYRS